MSKERQSCFCTIRACCSCVIMSFNKRGIESQEKAWRVVNGYEHRVFDLTKIFPFSVFAAIGRYFADNVSIKTPTRDTSNSVEQDTEIPLY